MSARPESQVGVRELGGNVYEASGCDKSARYVCDAFASRQAQPAIKRIGSRAQRLRLAAFEASCWGRLEAACERQS